jgi:CDP-diacylglycerol--serine O-phosphatidyltransferase
MFNTMTKKLQWVPNLFTLSNLSLGFFAVLLASREDTPHALSLAGGLILLAVLCDGLDGYAARLLNARSELGAQLDSLADLTTFGIAPATVMYSLVLKSWTVDFGGPTIPFGMIIAVVWPATAAYRLARFNVSHSDNSFTGLPSPVAGLIVGLMPVVNRDIFEIPFGILVIIYVLVSFLMVSTVRFSKPQVTLFRKFSPLRMGFLIAFLTVGLAMLAIRFGAGYAAFALLLLIAVYVASGIVSFLIHAIQEFKM